LKQKSLVQYSGCTEKNPDLLIGIHSLNGGADGDRTHDLSLRPLSHWVVKGKNYNIPFAISSNLPLTDLKYLSLEAALDRVKYSS